MAGGRGDLASSPRKKSVNRTPAVIRVRDQSLIVRDGSMLRFRRERESGFIKV